MGQSSYLQHVSIHVLIWSNVALAPLSFVAHESVELVTLYLVLYLSSLMFIFPFVVHTRRATCFHCMRGFPTNPSAEVTERIWWLNVWHNLFSSWKPLSCLIHVGDVLFRGGVLPALRLGLGRHEVAHTAGPVVPDLQGQRRLRGHRGAFPAAPRRHEELVTATSAVTALDGRRGDGDACPSRHRRPVPGKADSPGRTGRSEALPPPDRNGAYLIR
jgi:hypothetical protein